MVITDTPTTSFEIVSIDTVGPLRMSNNFRYILTIQCDLTKYVVAYPMETKEAVTVAKTLVEQFILKYGCFKILKSDRGTEFNNELMDNICKSFNIEQKFSTPYHHQTLGSIERNHRVLNEFLLAFSNDNDWDKWIPYYTFAYNTTPHIDTIYTPYELVFGKIAYLPNDIITSKNPVYNLDDYNNELKVRLRESINRTREIINKVKIDRKKKFDENVNPSNFKVGDLVLVKLGNRKKHQTPYKGPYIIIKQNDVNSIIDMNGETKEVHNNMLKKFTEII